MASLSSNLQNALAARAVQNLDVLRIYDNSATPVLLAEFTGLTWGPASNGQISVTNVPLEVSALASGTMATATLTTSGTSGEEITGLTVGTSGAQVTVSNTSVNSGQPVRLQSCTLTVPATVS